MVRLSTIREWDKLLAEATKPGAKGTIGIEIPFVNGRLGEPRITHTRYGYPE